MAASAQNTASACTDGIDPWYAEHLLKQLRRRHQARLRVIDVNGYLVADSSQLGPRREPRQETYRPPRGGANRSWDHHQNRHWHP